MFDYVFLFVAATVRRRRWRHLRVFEKRAAVPLLCVARSTPQPAGPHTRHGVNSPVVGRHDAAVAAQILAGLLHLRERLVEGVG